MNRAKLVGALFGAGSFALGALGWLMVTGQLR